MIAGKRDRHHRLNNWLAVDRDHTIGNTSNRENGGLRRANGDTFRAKLLSRGGSVDPMEAFRDLRGRDPEITPLLTRRGLLSASTT